MKIFSAAQIRDWDQFTIQQEPVASIDLMERAAAKCAAWIDRNITAGKEISIFCGPGNNGGDGLVTARLLMKEKRKLRLYILESNQYSRDFSINLERLATVSLEAHYLRTPADFPEVDSGHVIIDALYGSGLNRPLDGIAAQLVAHLNQSGSTILSIDIASGLFADKSSRGNPVIRPAHTLTFQAYKLAFLLPENEDYTGELTVLDIGLHPDYDHATATTCELVTPATARSLYRPRKPFAHKGNYGSLLLIAGSHGMMGAAVLAAKACLRSGAGKLTCYIPGCGYPILQSTVPEAMCLTDKGETYITATGAPQGFDAVAMGPGLGRQPDSLPMLQSLFEQQTPLVLDADALNLLATQPQLYTKIPRNTILTPHPKEFERLFGKTGDEFERLQLAMEKAQELGIYIVLKGKYSFIATPGGRGYFNSTGNPGMATGGSGDVLTGILLGMLGQYPTRDAVVLGVYLHGLAGDLAAMHQTQEAMTAGDITDFLPDAFRKVTAHT